MERYTELCGDNRFELIKKYKEKLIEATNIETSKDEMDVIDSVLFRFWQMDWLDMLENYTVLKSEHNAAVTALDNSTKEFLKLHDDFQNLKSEQKIELEKSKKDVIREIVDIIDYITGAEYNNHDEIEVAFMQGAKKVRSEIMKKYNINEKLATEDNISKT